LPITGDAHAEHRLHQQVLALAEPVPLTLAILMTKSLSLAALQAAH
jgi:hypothetical protein